MHAYRESSRSVFLLCHRARSKGVIASSHRNQSHGFLRITYVSLHFTCASLQVPCMQIIPCRAPSAPKKLASFDQTMLERRFAWKHQISGLASQLENFYYTISFLSKKWPFSSSPLLLYLLLLHPNAWRVCRTEIIPSGPVSHWLQLDKRTQPVLAAVVHVLLEIRNTNRTTARRACLIDVASRGQNIWHGCVWWTRWT